MITLSKEARAWLERSAVAYSHDVLVALDSAVAEVARLQTSHGVQRRTFEDLLSAATASAEASRKEVERLRAALQRIADLPMGVHNSWRMANRALQPATEPTVSRGIPRIPDGPDTRHNVYPQPATSFAEMCSAVEAACAVPDPPQPATEPKGLSCANCGDGVMVSAQGCCIHCGRDVPGAEDSTPQTTEAPAGEAIVDGLRNLATRTMPGDLTGPERVTLAIGWGRALCVVERGELVMGKAVPVDYVRADIADRAVALLRRFRASVGGMWLDKEAQIVTNDACDFLFELDAKGGTK
jgi:hypothetical protein